MVKDFDMPAGTVLVMCSLGQLANNGKLRRALQACGAEAAQQIWVKPGGDPQSDGEPYLCERRGCLFLARFCGVGSGQGDGNNPHLFNEVVASSGGIWPEPAAVHLEGSLAGLHGGQRHDLFGQLRC